MKKGGYCKTTRVGEIKLLFQEMKNRFSIIMTPEPKYPPEKQPSLAFVESIGRALDTQFGKLVMKSPPLSPLPFMSWLWLFFKFLGGVVALFNRVSRTKKEGIGREKRKRKWKKGESQTQACLPSLNTDWYRYREHTRF